MTVIFRVVLSDAKEEFIEQYDTFVERLKAKGEDPEFGKIIPLKKDQQKINDFFSQEEIILDEYMKPLFEKIALEI